MTTGVYDPAMPDTEWITRAEAAKRLNLSLETVDRYVREDLIERRKNPITKAVRLKLADVKRVQAQRAEEA